MKKHTPLRKKLLAVLIAASVGAVTVVPNVALAQSVSASLRGRAAPNAEITVTNTGTGLTRRLKADNDGSYTVVGLPPGSYRVDAGADVTRTVTLSVAETGTLDLLSTTAAPAASTTTTLNGVSVTASSLTEVKTSEIGTSISNKMIKTIPAVSRNFLEFADTVPGVQFVTDGVGNNHLQGGAQSASSTNIYIDGVGQKSYVLAGGVSGQNTSQGSPFPAEAIGEYKVITQNYKAEYDQVSSAAVVAGTKSGTNEFHGDVFGDYFSQGLQAQTPDEKNTTGKKVATHTADYGFSLGGPIIQDAMHFFIAYEAKDFATGTVVTPGSSYGSVASGAPLNNFPANLLALTGTVSNPFRENQYFAKIDWEPTDRDVLYLSAAVRTEHKIDNVQGVETQSYGDQALNDETHIVLDWQHTGDHWFNDLKFAHERVIWGADATGVGNGYIYTYAVAQNNNPAVLETGAGPNSQQKNQQGPSIQDDLTFTDLNWLGDHTVKMGVKYKEVTFVAQDPTIHNPQFYYNVTNAGVDAAPYRVDFGVPLPGVGNGSAITGDKQFGTYIQDDWAVNDKLTLNLGVRWDYEKTPTYLDFVTPANVVAALNGPYPGAPGVTYAQALAKGGININNYISTGNNRSAPTNEFQPRLGFSYDINGDEQHVIIGGVGRSYDRDLYDLLQLEKTKGTFPTQTIYFQGAQPGCATLGSNCFVWNPNYLTSGLAALQNLVGTSGAGREIDLINNNLKVPYSDQASLGMRNTVGDWNTSATVSYIISKNGFYFNLGNRYPDGTFWNNGCQAWCNNGYNTAVPGFGNLILGQNGLETKATSLLLSAEKPYTKESGWGATLAYTYTHAKQNYDQDQYEFDLEHISDFPWINSQTVPKSRFVGTLIYDIPWGIELSSKLVLATELPVEGTIPVPNGTGPGGASSIPATITPGGGRFITGGKIWGEREIDIGAVKNFETWGLNSYVRLDIFNLFNFNNYNQWITNFQSTGTTWSPNLTGTTSTPMRTLKVSAGVSW